GNAGPARTADPGRFRRRISRRAGVDAPGYNCTIPRPPKIIGATIADTREQFDHALESNFVARIRNQAKECGHILNMGLLEETDSARDLIWNTAARQLQLQFDRVIMSAVQNRDLV